MPESLLDRANELRQRAATTLAEARGLAETAEEEDRDLNDDEQGEWDGHLAEAERLNARAQRLEDQHRRELDLPKPGQTPAEAGRNLPPRPDDGGKPEFRNLGEFIHTIRYNRTDQRLQDTEQLEDRAQAMGTGVHDGTNGPLGGFAVPEQFREQLLEVAQQGALIRPRAFVIPPGSPPDAPIYMPALDQTSSGQNRYGGVDVQWIAEAATKPETSAQLAQVELTPQEVAGHIVVNDKLLRNWTAADAVLRRLLAGAVTSASEQAYTTGSGSGQPQGIVGSGAAFEVARATANEIVYEDVANMYARLLMGGSPVWLASQSILPQLLTMEDNGGRLIFQPGIREGVQPQLLGFPILWNERSPALGVEGDLVLADLQYYLIKDGSGPFIAASEHVHFKTNQTVIRIFFLVDGKPWLTAPLPLENDYEVSPFVVLSDPTSP